MKRRLEVVLSGDDLVKLTDGACTSRHGPEAKQYVLKCIEPVIAKYVQAERDRCESIVDDWVSDRVQKTECIVRIIGLVKS